MVMFFDEYTGLKKHVSTSWYLFNTNDTSDLSKAFYSDLKSSSLYAISISMTKANAYGFAIMHLDDDSIIEVPVGQISNDTISSFDIFEEPVSRPRIIDVTTFTDTNNTLSLTTTSIEPSSNTLKSLIAIFTIGTTIIVKKSTSTSITLSRDEVPDYHYGKPIHVEVAHTNTNNVLSPFTSKTILVDNVVITQTSILKNVDIVSNITPTFTKPFNSFYISLNGETVYHGKTHIPAFTLKEGKDYKLVVSFQIGILEVTRTFNITTLSSRELFDINDTKFTGNKNPITIDISTLKAGYYEESTLGTMFSYVNRDIIHYQVDTSTKLFTYQDMLTKAPTTMRSMFITSKRMLMQYNTGLENIIDIFDYDVTTNGLQKVFTTTIDIKSNVTTDRYGNCYYIDSNLVIKKLDINNVITDVYDIRTSDIVTSNIVAIDTKNLNISSISRNKLLIRGSLNAVVVYDLDRNIIDVLDNATPIITKSTEVILQSNTSAIMNTDGTFLLYDHMNDKETSYTTDYFKTIIRKRNGSLLVSNGTNAFLLN